jgi:hypothetical protein
MIDWNRRSYSKEEFIEAWNSSRSVAECLRKLHRQDRGGNYRVANETAEHLGLTADHMTGQGWSLGRTTSRPSRKIEEILVEGSKVSSSGLRLRLIREGFFEHMCYKCLGTEWMGKPIPLELEHINGVHRDNRLENLTLLCPNCHAQTDTYRGKNQKRAGVGQRRAGLLKITDEDKSVAGSNPVTCTCGRPMHKSSRVCRYCRNNQQPTKIEWPTLEELQKMITVKGYLQTGKTLGVSDNAVRKAVKRMTRQRVE